MLYLISLRCDSSVFGSFDSLLFSETGWSGALLEDIAWLERGILRIRQTPGLIEDGNGDGVKQVKLSKSGEYWPWIGIEL